MVGWVGVLWVGVGVVVVGWMVLLVVGCLGRGGGVGVGGGWGLCNGGGMVVLGVWCIGWLVGGF